MKRFSNLAVAVAVAVGGLAAAGGARAATWELDAAHTTVGFAVDHMMVTKQKGAFDAFTGTIELDENDVTKSKVAVEIDVKSVNTKNKKRDDHLRSPEFFDAEKFPKMTFTSTKVDKAKEGGGLLVTGDLTIRGVKKPVTLNVAPISPAYKDPWGGVHRGTSATTTINRKDFGLVWNQKLEKGGLLVGEEVTIELQIELLPKAAAPATAG
jgi:polyisoprenoid-binding protein YceI